jgi:hypothetical protein
MVAGGIWQKRCPPCPQVKNGSVHPIRGDELRMLTALRREYPDSGYVFTSQHDTPFTPDAMNRLVKTIGKRTGPPPRGGPYLSRRLREVSQRYRITIRNGILNSERRGTRSKPPLFGVSNNHLGNDLLFRSFSNAVCWLY